MYLLLIGQLRSRCDRARNPRRCNRLDGCKWSSRRQICRRTKGSTTQTPQGGCERITSRRECNNKRSCEWNRSRCMFDYGTSGGGDGPTASTGDNKLDNLQPPNYRDKPPTPRGWTTRAREVARDNRHPSHPVHYHVGCNCLIAHTWFCFCI